MYDHLGNYQLIKMMKNRIPSYCCPFVIYALLILCMNSSVIFGHQCIESERQALLEFKSGILEDDYGRLSDWSNEEDNKECCKWIGVGCSNQTGHVIGLDLHAEYDYHIHGWAKGKGPLKGKINLSTLRVLQLSYLNLSNNDFEYMPFNPGTIPYQLGNLSDLQYLDLSGYYYDLSGNFDEPKKPIPNFIGFLTKLNHLDLSYAFAGTIPPQLGNLSNLHYLDLSGNYIDLSGYNMSVENLEWLSRLSFLEHLDMDSVDLSKAEGWVNIIMNLPSLSYLSLFFCQLSQVKLPYDTRNGLNANSSRYSSRISLDLSANFLTTSMYRWLFNISNNIVSLNLFNNDLTGQIPEAFGRMASLSYLGLFLNHIDGVAPNSLGNLCNLTRLTLASNKLSGNLEDFLDNLSGCANATLEVLDLGENEFTGSLPDNIIRFPSLQELDLQNNQLNGGVTENLGKLRNLSYLDLSSNSLQGVVSDVHLTPLSKLTYLDLSSNSLTLELSSQWVPPFQLEYIDLHSCKQGPDFPNWIRTQKRLSHLNMANGSISGTIPQWFWDIQSTRLRYFSISSNQISGTVPNLSSKFDLNPAIDMSSNNLEGPIPLLPPNITSLNLSTNKFSGTLFFLCQLSDLGFLNFLDLSHNSLTGELPDCLSYFRSLVVLNLANNKISGKIPSSIASLISLEVLYLYNNSFSGELPFGLSNCTQLTFLDLGVNMFTGTIPARIGENLLGLYALILRSNKFLGTIPLHICQLKNLRLLDISSNNLSGFVPTCMTNFTPMVMKYSVADTDHRYGLDFGFRIGIGKDLFKYGDHAIIQWQGSGREFGRNLGLLTSIDLSNNNLKGEIPDEITNLVELLVLNLSGNQLSGKIPQNIGQLVSLMTLDLSRNHLSGGIPSSISRISSLSYLNLSYNNLSGKIPLGTQLQTFNVSQYIGNAGLCGLPVSLSCPGVGQPPTVMTTGVSSYDGDTNEFLRWFYIGAGTGFATGFWAVCGILLLNRHMRHAFFLSLSKLYD